MTQRNLILDDPVNHQSWRLKTSNQQNIGKLIHRQIENNDTFIIIFVQNSTQSHAQLQNTQNEIIEMYEQGSGVCYKNADTTRLYLGSNIVDIPEPLPRHQRTVRRVPRYTVLTKTSSRKTSSDYKQDSEKFFSASEKVKTYLSTHFIAYDERHIPRLFAVTSRIRTFLLIFQNRKVAFFGPQ